jgi:uncharacterized protein involved in type VI secretion and phage assembly
MSDHDLFSAGSDDKRGHGTRIIQTRVVDNCDRARLGRVMVAIPWLEGPVVAIVATIGAGEDRGLCFTPQTNDEVLVLIKEQPDLTAYVIGSIHTSKETPPERRRQSPSPQVQMIRTPGKHEIVFDDKTGELVIKAASGHTVSLTKKSVEIRSVKNNDDKKAAAFVTLDADGTIAIEGSSISLKATGGALTLSGMSVELKATSGDCVIKGAPNVRIN